MAEHPLEGELVEAPDEPHNLKSRPTRFGVEYVCTCGGWDGWANTPRMQQVVRAQHHDHWLQHARR